MTETSSIPGTKTAGRRGLVLRILLLALAFWVIDALLYAVAYEDDGLVDALLSPEPLEFWLRVLAVGVIAAGALFIDRAGRRASLAGFEHEIDQLGSELAEAEQRLRTTADEREAAARALRASESRYRGLFESSPTPILVVDQETGRIMEANPAADAFVGYGPGELATMRIWDLNGVSEDEMLERLAETLERGARVVRSRFKLADGSWRDVEVTTSPVALDDGTTLLHGTVTDISDRIMVQEAMEAAFDELEQVFQSAADGLRVVATDYSIMKVNDTFVELSGLREQELLGKKCYDVFPGAQCHTPACPVQRILAGGRRVDFEADKRRVDGSSVPCLVTARPYYVEGVLMGIVESFRDISERRIAEETIRHMALHDQLTGLPNRSLLSDRLEMALTRARRHSEGLALLFMDIDGFKEINDEMGHAAGDKLLADFARRIQGILREEDTMARMGGDEFVVLLPGATRRADVARVLDEITRASSAPFEWEGEMAYVGASIGVALLDDPSESQDSLLRRADHAMYAAKECGGGAAFAAPRAEAATPESGQPAAQCADGELPPAAEGPPESQRAS
jgi:diguanylate cyclase (GGDEF)-like protein/PAS domain S-box-containing protein